MFRPPSRRPPAPATFAPRNVTWQKSSGAIIGSWRDLNKLNFLYVLYRPTDAMCCPTGGAVSVRYRWNGKKVVRLDPLPPRTASKNRPGRYP